MSIQNPFLDFITKDRRAVDFYYLLGESDFYDSVVRKGLEVDYYPLRVLSPSRAVLKRVFKIIKAVDVTVT